MQEPQAQERLLKQGRVVRLAWRRFDVQVTITPAGLLELNDAPEADLTLTVTDDSPFDLAKSVATVLRLPFAVCRFANECALEGCVGLPWPAACCRHRPSGEALRSAATIRPGHRLA